MFDARVGDCLGRVTQARVAMRRTPFRRSRAGPGSPLLGLSVGCCCCLLLPTGRERGARPTRPTRPTSARQRGVWQSISRNGWTALPARHRNGYARQLRLVVLCSVLEVGREANCRRRIGKPKSSGPAALGGFGWRNWHAREGQAVRKNQRGIHPFQLLKCDRSECPEARPFAGEPAKTDLEPIRQSPAPPSNAWAKTPPRPAPAPVLESAQSSVACAARAAYVGVPCNVGQSGVPSVRPFRSVVRSVPDACIVYFFLRLVRHLDVAR